MEEKGISSSDTLTIGDLLDLGFDPTRLKEITIEGSDFIFERMQARMLRIWSERKELLGDLAAELGGVRFRNATVHIKSSSPSNSRSRQRVRTPPEGSRNSLGRGRRATPDCS